MRLTKEQAVIVSAYTGVLCCEFSDMHEYIEKIMERSVWTHEMADASVMQQIRNAAKTDFLSICAEGTNMPTEKQSAKGGPDA